jgi:predicted MFS family arabinose efflux permease
MRVPRHVRCVDTGWRLSRLHYAWVVAGVTFLVPPTVRLASDLFGRNNAGVIFGWIAAAHQLGAALAALCAGAIRTAFGDYSGAFWISGTICVLASISFLFSRKLLDKHASAFAAPSSASGEAQYASQTT